MNKYVSTLTNFINAFLYLTTVSGSQALEKVWSHNIQSLGYPGVIPLATSTPGTIT